VWKCLLRGCDACGDLPFINLTTEDGIFADAGLGSLDALPGSFMGTPSTDAAMRTVDACMLIGISLGLPDALLHTCLHGWWTLVNDSTRYLARGEGIELGFSGLDPDK
jgi:hypothetical protein